MNSGYLAAFGTLACWTIGTIAFTKASKLTQPTIVNRVRLIFAVVLLTIITVVLFGINLKQLFLLPTLSEWFWLGISGVIGLTLGDYFAFTAYSVLGSSRTSMFSTFAPVAAVLLGMCMLNETITLVGFLGMATSIGGIIYFITAAKKLQTENLNKKLLSKGVLYAILGAICQGLGLVCTKKALNIEHINEPDLSAVHATWIRILVATIAAYSIAFFTKNIFTEFKTLITTPHKIKPVLVGTIFGPVCGVSLSLYAATQIPVGVAQTIFSLLPISVMLAATITNTEKLNLTAIIAACISVIGVFILVWQHQIAIWFV